MQGGVEVAFETGDDFFGAFNLFRNSSFRDRFDFVIGEETLDGMRGRFSRELQDAVVRERFVLFDELFL